MKIALQGLRFLHSLDFLHRDIAARNVLLDSELRCKIADFGLSRDMDGKQYYTMHRMAIPLRWSAPEVVNDSKFYKASDVWSFGILAMEIYTNGADPYQGWSNQRVTVEISCGYRLPCPMACPAHVYDTLILPCWAHEPADRPSFEDLAQGVSNVFPEHGCARTGSVSSGSRRVWLGPCMRMGGRGHDGGGVGPVDRVGRRSIRGRMNGR